MKMKTEMECEKLAREKLQEYVNSCQCQTKEDAEKVIFKMVGMCTNAIYAIKHGESATQH